jgi:hypothetical protein
MRRLLLNVTLFLAAAAIPMIIAAPRVAKSAVRTVSGQGGACVYGSMTPIEVYSCSFTVGTDFPTAALNGIFVDFSLSTSAPVTVSLIKSSYTGSLYDDNNTITAAAGPNNRYVTAANVKQNPSQYDYVFGVLAHTLIGNQPKVLPNSLIGMALDNSN